MTYCINGATFFAKVILSEFIFLKLGTLSLVKYGSVIFVKLTNRKIGFLENGP